jgi:putative FmdB family regulatory protein
MPIYDYRCSSCGTQFEQLVRSEQAVSCPQCSSRDLDRLMSVTARPGGSKPDSDFSRLGPPPGSGCCGGGCHSHPH